MVRTTIMADPELLERLRALARQRRVSLAEITREALQAKAEEYEPELTFLGVGSSGRTDASSLAGVGRAPSR